MRNRRIKKKTAFKRLTALLMAMIMVVGLAFQYSTSAEAALSQKVDEDTSSSWEDDNFLGHEYSTEFAGRVWTDKSVNVVDGSKTDFEVKYSALSTSKAVTGQTQAPLDVVFVIDISGSMANNNSGMPENANDRWPYDNKTRMHYTVQAVNDSIESIMAMNEHTRVGVVIFSNTAQTVLPLGRYTKAGNTDYLTLNNDEPDNSEPYAELTVRAQEIQTRRYNVQGGTNIQQGIYTGASLLTAANNQTTTVINGQTVNRIPAMVVLSDGAPTYSSNSSNWWAPNADGGRDGNGSGFYYGNGMKAMMTAAYMKQAINAKYGVTDANSAYAAKFHTIGMGITELTGDAKNLANVTLNPGQHYNANNTMSNNIRSKWNEYANHTRQNQTISVQVNSNNSMDSLGHPSSGDIKSVGISSWVDQYHTADQADSVANVFAGIVQDLALSIPEVPTEVKTGQTFADGGYLTYTDPIGKYMVVKGTDMEFEYWNGEEYETYTATDADKDGTYTFANGTQIIGSDGNQYDINKIKIELTTDEDGFQTLVVNIPAILIPLRVNEVNLNAQGQITSHTHNGEMPCSLIYTVGLHPDIYDAETGNIRFIPVDTTDAENPAPWSGEKLEAYQQYLEDNKADGEVSFFSNLFTGKTIVNNKTGQPHTVGDAIVSFEPSHTNAFYYIQEDMPIYVDEDLTTPATGTINDNATYYYKETFYHLDDAEDKAVARTGRQLKAVAIEQNENGEWYRVSGSVRLNKLQLFENQKTPNETGTAEDWYVAEFVHAVGDSNPANGHFEVHLGNNGALKAKVAGNLEITKNVTADEGLTAPDKEFTFTLKLTNADDEYGYRIDDADGNLVTQGMIKDGDTFTLKHGQKITIANLPVDARYEVTEAEVKGFTTTSKVNDAEAVASYEAEGTITSGNVEEVLYTNNYSVDEIIVNEDDTTADFGVKKVLSGREWEEGTDEYTFILESNRVTTPMPEGSTGVPASNPTHYLKEITVDSESQAADFAFGEIKYDKPGTYTYTISERVPATGLPGVSYSGAMYQVIVEITDANGDGELEKSITMNQIRDDLGTTGNVKEIADDTAVFTNTFSTTSVVWTPVGTKDYTDYTGTNTLKNGMFEFTVSVNANSPANTPLPASAVNGVTREFNIGPQIGYDAITFTKDHVNADGSVTTYIYDFKEVIPAGAVDNGNGTYSLNGYTYDGDTREVKVNVHLNDKGEIIVEPVYETEVDGIRYDRVVFFNKYDANSTTAAFKGTKTLTGRDWKDTDTFTFVLSATDQATVNAITNNVITGVNKEDMNSLASQTVTSANASEFSFSDITFTKPGTYKFNITETKASIAGVTYDTHVTEVTVVVKDTEDANGNKLGQLAAEVTYNNRSALADADKAVTDKAAFTNTYDAADSAPINLSGTKTLTGRDMRTGEFFLNVLPQNNAPMGSSSQGNSVPAAADGVASAVSLLKDIVYTEEGTYVYLIKEHIPADVQKLGGITYDENTVYRVTVTVADNTEGKLVVTPVVEKSTDKGATYTAVGLNDVAFNNSYSVTDATYTPLSLKKELTGKTLEAGEFTFKVEADASNPEGMTLPTPATAVNDANGDIKFGNITFSEPGRYVVRVSEVVPADADKNPGMTYSDNVYEVEFNVTDNGYGKLEVERTILSGENIFRNEYKTTGNLVGETYLKVTKNYVDDNDVSAWKDGDSFTFYLEAADDATKLAVRDGIIDMNGAGNGTPQFSEVTISASDAVKSKAFDNITFNQAGTFVFSLFEITDSPIEGVHYDSALRTVTVTATDNGSGTLTVTAVVEGGTGLTFNNKYDTTETEVYGWDDLQVTKDLVGREWKDGETYSFTISVEDPDTQAAIDAKNILFAEDFQNTITMTKDNRFTLSFGNIEFHEEGEFEFVITEDLPEGTEAGVTEIDGVEYDRSKEVVTITVTDTDDSANTVLKITEIAYSDDDNDTTDEDKIHFINKYDSDEVTLEGETNLAIRKTLTGRKWTANDSFEFTLKLVDPETLEAITDANVVMPEGSIIIKNTTEALDDAEAGHFGNITFKEEGVYYFLIEEAAGSLDNMTYDSHDVLVRVDVVDSEAQVGKLVATPTYMGEMEFENKYTPDPIPVTLDGTKTLTGRELKDTDRFRFNISAVTEGAPMPDMTQVTTSTKIDANTRAVSFGPILYNAEGTYVYTITEQAGSINGVTYDETVWKATVVITDADEDGKFEKAVSYVKEDGTTTDPSTFAFKNSYDASDSAPVEVKATKSMSVAAGESFTLGAGQFTFELEPSEDNSSDDPLKGQTLTATNDANGNVVFDGITFTAEGTYVYTLSEAEGNLAGVTYDGADYIVTVVVTDNEAAGKLETAVTITKDGKAVTNVVFDNGYNPADIGATFKGTKTFTDTTLDEAKAQEAGQFTFVLSPVSANAPMPASAETVNDTAGNFAFGEITFTQPGTYQYQISEKEGTDSHIGYDDAVYTVTVVVTDVDGALKADVSYSGNVVFENTYTPDPLTDAVITGTKELTGRDMTEGEFTFNLVQGEEVVATAKNDAKGKFTIEVPEITKADTYTYVVVEEKAGTTADGVTYDAGYYTVVLTVEDVDGELTVTDTQILKDQKDTDAVKFENSYEAKATSVQLGATKVLNGRELKEGEFEFELRDADGKVLETVKNDAEGKVLFSEITYEEAGETVYTIVEKAGSLEYVTYDETEYKVVVKITDDGKGNLVPNVDTEGKTVVFTNKYEKPEEPTKPTTPDSPTKTGDNANILTYLFAILASLIAAFVVLIKRRLDYNKR